MLISTLHVCMHITQNHHCHCHRQACMPCPLCNSVWATRGWRGPSARLSRIPYTYTHEYMYVCASVHSCIRHNSAESAEKKERGPEEVGGGLAPLWHGMYVQYIRYVCTIYYVGSAACAYLYFYFLLPPSGEERKGEENNRNRNRRGEKRSAEVPPTLSSLQEGSNSRFPNREARMAEIYVLCSK